ncbi:MAG TPA: hypothetical protein VGX23_23280 [Actinocrinis sp.]|nr:hypothetical protein [Actinocrinis sp.]
MSMPQPLPRPETKPDAAPEPEPQGEFEPELDLEPEPEIGSGPQRHPYRRNPYLRRPLSRRRVPAALLAAGFGLGLAPILVLGLGIAAASASTTQAGPAGASTLAATATVTAESRASVIWAVVVVLVLVAVLMGVMAFRHRRALAVSAAAGDGARGDGRPGVIELEAEAAQLLVRTDDAVKTSEQELGFAIAQFGGQAAAAFSEALEEAKADLSDAFWLRGKLNENAEIAPEQRHEWLQQVIGKCRRANADLDAQTLAFEQLRDLRNRTPEVLDGLDQTLGDAPARIGAAVETLRQAAERYSAQALEPVAQNPAQATDLVGFAADAAERSRRLFVSGDTGQAALAARTAQEASGQVDRLLEATDRRVADLDQARAALPAVVTEVDRDVAEARVLLGTGSSAGSRRLVGLEEETARIRAAAAAAGDPLTLLGHLQTVDVQLDELMIGVLGDKERKANAEAMLEQALLAARSDVAAAEDFITTRRGAIGSQARTLQAEGIRQLDKALYLQYREDAQGARVAARRASSYARSAQQQATADVQSFGTLGIGDPGIEGAGVSGLDAGLAAGGTGLSGAVISGLVVQAPANGPARSGGQGRNRSGPRSPGGFQGASTAPSNRRGAGGRA